MKKAKNVIRVSAHHYFTSPPKRVEPMETTKKDANRARVSAQQNPNYALRYKLRSAVANAVGYKKENAHLRDLLRIKEMEYAGKVMLLEAKLEDFKAGFPLSELLAMPISILSTSEIAAENLAKALELLNKLAFVMSETKEAASDGLTFMREFYGNQ